MCRLTTSQTPLSLCSPDSQARVKRMQMRADDAAQSAAQEQVRCEKKKAQLQQLKMEMDAQLSNPSLEACNSPLAVSKRIDSLYLNGYSSPTQRFSHQLDLIHGNQIVVDKLQKRIDLLEKGCKNHGEDSTSCNCSCIHCCQVRAQKKQKMAETLALAAEVAQKQSCGHRGHSVAAVEAGKTRAAKHLRSLQESAKLYEVPTECAPAQDRPSSARLMRRTLRSSAPSASKFTSHPGSITQEGLPAVTHSESCRPRSASCVLEKSRRSRVSNADF